MNKLFTVGLFLIIVLGSAIFWFFSHDKSTEMNTDETVGRSSPAAITIIAFGDSLTAGYGVQLSEAYPAQLERALSKQGYDVTVVNSGVSGETTRGNVERANFIRTQEPDIVILGTGGNDALRSLPILNTKENIAATLDILLAGEEPPEVLLLKMQAPLNAGEEYKQEFDSIYEELSDKKEVVLVPFLTEDIFFDQSNKLPDGIHYNQQGYQKVIERYLQPAVIQVLENDA